MRKDLELPTIQLPAADQVLQGVNVGVSTTGTVTLPTAGDVRQGVQFGANLALVGALDPGAGVPPCCNSDGATNCVAFSNYPAVDKINKLTPGNIKSGVTVASVVGAYPSTQYPLIGADSNTTDLPAFADTTGGASYEWFKSDGTRVTGSIQSDATMTPSAAQQTLTAGLYRSVTVSGDADLVASNIKTDVNIFGVQGSVRVVCVPP